MKLRIMLWNRASGGVGGANCLEQSSLPDCEALGMDLVDEGRNTLKRLKNNYTTNNLRMWPSGLEP